MREASKTALMVAGYRARASGRSAPLCTDPWAEALAGDEGRDIASAYDATFPHMELWIAVRTAFIDERVRRFTSTGGIGQVVLLGAGFDTRAARLARDGVRFFEVDQPESQRNKLARLSPLAGYPIASATYVTCDFEHQEFLARLAAGGFDAAQPALFVWEGVVPYLTEPAVRATLRRIAEATHEGSVVIFDHVQRRIVAGEVKAPRDLESRAFVAQLGEPLRFGVDYPLPLLYEEGFRRVLTTTFDEACLCLTGTYDRARMFKFQSMVVASRAASLGV